MNHHFLAWCLSSPWALRPETMLAYASVLARRYGQRATAQSLEDDAPGAPSPAAAAPRAGTSGPRRGAIAVIPVHGAIVQRASQINICDGGTSTQQISAAVRDALADETVSQILLDIDSPGGSVYGVGELADEIRAARAQKPVVAIANSLAASAAYWLATAASEVYVTPGGEVGSIGVWMAHEDWSKALAEQGINVTLVSAGKYKVEGNPYGPLDADALAFLQQRTDDYYAAFTKAVAKGRSVPIDQVRGGMGQGRVLGADQALAEKMVDGIATFDEVVKKMQRAQPARGRSALAAARNELEILG